MTTPDPRPHAADGPASTEQTARFEVDFLTGMIDHHQMAVSMAETAVNKAVHEELASSSRKTIESQSAEIEQMQTWLRDWYDVDHEPQMSGMDSMDHLTDLSGEEFEVAFMRSMIGHHSDAIREAGKCSDNAQHADLLALCEKMRTAQLSEIEQMQTWLQEWYGVTAEHPGQSS